MTAQRDPGKSWRQTKGIPVVPAFDGYRTLAIGGVVLFHTLQASGALAVAGDSPGGIAMWGVLPSGSLIALFIVSGFVMFLPAAARNGDLGPVGVFAIRRAARLVPAYWLSLVVALVLLVAFSPLPGVAFPGLDQWLVHIGIVQTPALLIDGPVAVDGVTTGDLQLGLGVIPPVWTLSVEVAFYMALPLVAAAWYRHPWISLALAGGVAAAWYAIARNVGDLGSVFGIDLSAEAQARFSDFYASQLPSWALALGAGMTGAWLYVWLRDRFDSAELARHASQALLVSVPLLLIVFYLGGREAVDDPNPFAGLFARQPLAISLAYPLVIGATMIAFSLAPPRLQRPVTNRPMRWLADISYSVYLIHFAVIWFAFSQLSLAKDTLGAAVPWTALTIAVSLVYAYFSARLLERPIRTWAHRFRDRARAAERPAPKRRDVDLARVSVSEPQSEVPAVSIVIPTFNRADWLAGAIESVLVQDHPNLELVVVDDGSADRTPELLAELSAKLPQARFRAVRQDNAGQARALNRGNALARGEFIGYLSDDDVLAPGAVSKLAGALSDDPGAAVAYPGYDLIDATGAVEDIVRPIHYTPLEALRLHDTVIGPGGLARRDALESTGGWDPSLKWMGDLILWIGVGLAGRAIRIDEPLASWRRHPGSATVSLGVEHAREHLRLIDRAAAIPGMPELGRPIRAEALRNACLTAALFGGDATSWPGDEFVIFDLHRKRISAVSAGLGTERPVDWRQAERCASLYRELVTQMLAGATSAGEAISRRGGVAEAERLLRDAGALPLPGGGYADIADERTLRLALIDAAIACGGEAELAQARFLILDRRREHVDQTLLEQVMGLGFAGVAEEIEAALERARPRG